MKESPEYLLRLPVNRRVVMGAFASAVALGRVGRTAAQESTPASGARGDSDAVQVLTQAGQALAALDTFVFKLETVAGESTFMAALELKSVEGAVRRPTDLKATVTVGLPLGEMSLDAIAIDGEVFIQDPMNNNAWQRMGSAPEIVGLINPDWIVQAAVDVIQDAKITDTSERDGVTVTLIEGWVDIKELVQRGGGEVDQVAGMLSDGPVDLAIWVGKDNLITQVEIYGPIFSSESADVEKRITFDKFNEPVTIEKPNI